MHRITDEEIARLVADIVSEVAPEAVYLFGSRARGEAREDSDVDLLVIEREPFGAHRSRRRELSRLWQLVARHRLAVDVLVYSQEEVEDWRATPGHVIARALHEGKALYAA